MKLQPVATMHRDSFISYHSAYWRVNKMRAKIEQLKKKGQGLVEYALILVLIAIVVILILTFLGQQVNSTFSKIGSGLKG
jgi:pilus assembly protein Flp/PilA